MRVDRHEAESGLAYAVRRKFPQRHELQMISEYRASANSRTFEEALRMDVRLRLET